MSSGAVVIEERVHVPTDAVHLEGFRRWAHSDQFPTEGRICFLDGEVDVDMSPEEITTHNQVKGDVFAALWSYVRQGRLGHLLSDGAFLVNEAANLATEPDITFCGYDGLKSGRVSYREWVAGSERLVEVAGAPDLVVEVVSQHSVVKDTRKLPVLYYRAGVMEYWLIDARGNAIDFQIFSRGREQFVAVRPDADGYRPSDVLQGRFMLTRDDDPVVGYQYTLHRQ